MKEIIEETLEEVTKDNLALHRKVNSLESHLSTALSLSSAYREALLQIASLPWSFTRTVGDYEKIARAALDRKPEEAVGREVTREELAREIIMNFGYILDNYECMKITDCLLKTFRVERR